MKRYIDPDSEIDKIKETIKKLENSERECGINEQINIHYLQQLVGHLENAPAADVVSREEYNSLLKRFKHLIQSEFISSFDEVNRNNVYRRDIKEADQIAARFQKSSKLHCAIICLKDDATIEKSSEIKFDFINFMCEREYITFTASGGQTFIYPYHNICAITIF